MPGFCYKASLPFPTEEGDILIFVYDWEGYGRHYSQQALKGFAYEIDQCAGFNFPFKARFTHDKRQQDKAHGIFYNGRQYLSRGRAAILETYNRNQKTASVWHEQNVLNVFPHPYVDVEVSLRLNATVPLPYGCGVVISIMKQVALGTFKLPDPRTRQLGTAAFISNCAPAPERFQLLQALMKVTRVQSYGRCEHNSVIPVTRDFGDWEDRKMTVLQKHRALLAWENIQQKHYVTEKIFHALKAKVVPVYWGSDSIKDILPTGSYIDANGYTPETIHLLAEKLKRLESDDEYFISFFTALKQTKPVKP